MFNWRIKMVLKYFFTKKICNFTGQSEEIREQASKNRYQIINFKRNYIPLMYIICLNECHVWSGSGSVGPISYLSSSSTSAHPTGNWRLIGWLGGVRLVSILNQIWSKLWRIDQGQINHWTIKNQIIIYIFTQNFLHLFFCRILQNMF